jgi:FMN phosphatase YigB (HAD superfamily)|tara:strand:+ start:501 stop:791 length:291 start_codon:yes stop_codon:yes gene_type:complete
VAGGRIAVLIYSVCQISPGKPILRSNIWIFFKLFAGIVISGHEGCMKPGEAIFQLTLQRFNLSPTKTLFIDDSLPNILKALQLGISTYHFKRTDRC